MRLLLALTVTASIFAAGPQPAAKKKPADIVAVISAPAADLTRNLFYNDHEVQTLHARLHYTTVVVLPKAEKIISIKAGHSEEWTADAAEGTNVAYIKPEKSGARTNLNLATASGNVYSFIVEESGQQPDLKVFIETKDKDMNAAMAGPPKWVLAGELDLAKRQVESAQNEAREARDALTVKSDEMLAQADREIAKFRSEFPSTLRHDYEFKPNKDFGVKAIARDERFTYIWAHPQETPALYEMKDGKPSIINFTFANGLYIAPKVMTSGYLAIGKHKLEFKREGE